MTGVDPFGERPRGSRNVLLLKERLLLMNRKHFHWLISGWYRTGYEQGYAAGIKKAQEQGEMRTRESSLVPGARTRGPGSPTTSDLPRPREASQQASR